MATTFIINEILKNNGTFPRESVATLYRLGGWSEKSGTWSLYVKDVFEKHLDTSSSLYRQGSQHIFSFGKVSISINRSNVYGIKGEMIIKIYKR